MPGTSLFIFRRDLRLRDNTGLLAAMQSSDSVVPVFVIDTYLMQRWANAGARLVFLAHALQKLDREIAEFGGRLQIIDRAEVRDLITAAAGKQFNAVFCNRDYTPYARQRDARLKLLSEDNGLAFHHFADQLLNEPEAVFKADGAPYTVFTPYFRRAVVNTIPEPDEDLNFSFGEIDLAMPLEESAMAQYLSQPFDETSQDVDAALSNLTALDNYDDSKDIPGVRGTGRLSALLRFGLVSPRQVYHHLANNHDEGHGVIRQLYWRDFYFQIGFHFPHVYRGAFRQKYDLVPWDQNDEEFEAWCNGETGFPIVDAGMRELRETGYMHNRVRMVVASFLTKNLHIDWRRGEKHFARYLIDFDPALNNGNWQWAASTGCDAQPYFRVFNPWRQQLRFDKDCTYIKQWVPELSHLEAKQIHKLEKSADAYRPQIVDLKTSAEESKQRFKNTLSS